MIHSYTCLLVFLGLAFSPALRGSPATTTDPAKLVKVKAKATPADEWKEYSTRTLDALPGFNPGEPGPTPSKFGGRTDLRWEAKGFFRTKKIGGRWWLVDPEGHPFLHKGVVSVKVGPSPAVQGYFQQEFTNREKWAESTVEMLRDVGFNGLGAWSDTRAIRATSKPLPYTLIWDFMSGFGNSHKITTRLAGHAGYPNGCIPVFHPNFKAFCEKHAQKLNATKDDPYLIGHFSDNELPCPNLKKYLALDPSDPVMGSSAKAAREWLVQRKNKPAVDARNVTAEDQEAFIGFVYDRYFSITTAAIRGVDPNHLVLGSRFHSNEKKSPAAFAAAGKYLDVIGVNLYYLWTPDMQVLKDWEKWSGRPCLITEWYTKGADQGFTNKTGVGWIVPTQSDRGLFYQNYALQLLESGVCVGWDWFKYQDNDPADLTTDPSNRDSNKGMVSLDFKPYHAMLSRMKALNPEIYRLVDYFDGRNSGHASKLVKAPAEQGSTVEKEAKPQGVVLDPGLPNVLIVGDSISLGYTPHARSLLKGKANVLRPLTDNGFEINCEGTTSGVENIDAWLGSTRWDLIHFNFGLHDLKRVKKPGDSLASNGIKDPHQADLKTYGENLEKIVARLTRTGARLVFATTTPVPRGVATTHVLRKPEEVPIYNAAALRVMKRHQIEVNDLHGFCMPRLARLQMPKNVHFTDAGSRELGRMVAAAIEIQLKALPER